MEKATEFELLRSQRARLASRLKTPWWYVVVTACAWAVAVAMPIGSHYLIGAGAWCALLAVAMFVLAQHVFGRVSGVDVGLRTWQYPSGRVWTIAMIVIIVAASMAEALLLDHALLVRAIGVAVVATASGTACWHGHVWGIRRDLESGRAML